MQLAPNDSLVLAINGLMLGYAYDFAAEAEYYDRSLAINPSSGEVMNWKRLSLQLAGKFRDAQEVSLHMLEVDPMSMVTLANGIGAKASGQTADAQELELLLQRLDSLDASYGLSARAYLARIHGNIPLAIRYHFQTAEADPGRTSNLRETADLLFGLGLADEGLAVAPDQLYEAAMYRGDWGQAVDLARQAYEKNPDLIEEMQRLMSAVLRAGDVDEAFTIADKLWTEFGDYPSAMIDAMADMAWVAKKSEHPTEARKYRDGLATLAEALIDADISTYWSYSIYARLAVLDQRDNDAINALSRAIDTGARWPLLGQDPAFEDLHDNLDFQAQVSRMNELIEQERHEVLAMLCGPDTILSTWKPAPATCELYKGIAEGGS